MRVEVGREKGKKGNEQIERRRNRGTKESERRQCRKQSHVKKEEMEGKEHRN